MTRNEFKQQLAIIIEGSQPTHKKVEAILVAMGRLAPEPGSGNLKTVVPNYNSHLVRKVQKQGLPKVKFKPEQRNAARALLRKMGMI